MTSALTAPAGLLHRAAARPVRWRYHFTDFRTGRLLATLPMTGVKLTEVLSGVGTAEGTVTLAPAVRERDPFTATIPRRSCLWAERQELDPATGRVADTRVLWGGIVMARSRKLAARTLTVKAVSWEGYLVRRVLRYDYRPVQQDKFSIARTLLRYAWQQVSADEKDLSPAYPFYPPHIEPMTDTAGPLSGVLADRTYFASDLKPVGEALTELGNSGGGFDWRLEPYMQTPGDLTSFRVRALLGYPRLGRTAPPDLRWSTDPADRRQRWGQVLDLSLEEDGSAVNNVVYALGEGQPPDQLRAVAQEHAELDSGYCVYEATLGSSTADLRTQASVDQHAYGALTAQLASQVRVSGVSVRGDLPPVLTSYALGDDATLRIGEGITGQPATLVGQIIGRQITPAEPGETERVTFDVQGTAA